MLITFNVSKKPFQQESTCVLSWAVGNRLVSIFLHLFIFSFGLNFIWLFLVVPKGVEAKNGKGKAPMAEAMVEPMMTAMVVLVVDLVKAVDRGRDVFLWLVTDHCLSLGKQAVQWKANLTKSGPYCKYRMPLICISRGKVYFFIWKVPTHVDYVSFQTRNYSNNLMRKLSICRLAHFNNNPRKATASWCADQLKIPHSTLYNRVSNCPSSRHIQGAEHEAGGARWLKIFKDRGKFLFLVLLSWSDTCILLIKRENVYI